MALDAVINGAARAVHVAHIEVLRRRPRRERALTFSLRELPAWKRASEASHRACDTVEPIAVATKKAAKTQTGRKAFGYGDEEFDVDADLGDPEGLASAIEQFVDAVDALISGDPS